MNNTLLIIFAGITFLFALAIFLKAKINLFKNICAICAAVGITWIVGLILAWLGAFADPEIFAVLIGGSAVGFFYLMKKKTPEKLHIFQLPFLLTMFLGAYALTRTTAGLINPALFLMALWTLASLIYAFRSSKNFSALATRIIECCKNW